MRRGGRDGRQNSNSTATTTRPTERHTRTGGQPTNDNEKAYVKLPDGRCWRLKRWIYGMRPAAQAWEADLWPQIQIQIQIWGNATCEGVRGVPKYVGDACVPSQLGMRWNSRWGYETCEGCAKMGGACGPPHWGLQWTSRHTRNV